MSQDHSFVSPGPAGLGALAVACFGFGAVFTGQVGLGGLPLLAAWLVGGGIVQYTVAVMELKDHNMTGGNVFLFFSAFFMFGAALSVFFKYLMLAGILGDIKPQPMVEGFCWMAGAAFLTAVTPSYLKSPTPLFLIVLLLDIALWIIVCLDMGLIGASLKPVVGYLLFAAGWIAIYLVAAIVNNHVFGRVIFPTFGSLIK
ncbi:MAG: succinate-acetate transporter protein [Desulforhopalus sp.]|jgi:succinate-acetate transporter protein